MFFLLPSEGGFVDGLPLGGIDTIGLVVVVWIAAHRVRIAGGWIAAGVGVAALALSLAVPGQRGLQARYFATDTAGVAHERSSENGDRDFTRVDTELDFAVGMREFPLAFVNDHTRFNFMQQGDPDRRKLAFAAAWTGWWFSPAGPQTIFLNAPGARAQISIDGEPVVTSDHRASEDTRTLTLPAGWHRLHITLASPYGAPRVFSAGVLRDGAREAFGRSQSRTERIDGRQQALARTLAAVKPIADVLALGWVLSVAGLLLLGRAGALWQQRLDAATAALTLVLAAGVVDALRFAWPWASRLRIMTAGDDTMVYEAYARDILLNGILMNGGLPLGEGEPFYFQAFYPYFLAATHAIFGESFFGALFLQRAFVAATVVTLTAIAMRVRGAVIWPFGLIVSAAFCYWKLAPISADLLSEALYVPLLALSILAMMRATDTPTTGNAWRAGLAAGVTAITRSTAMLAWAVLWIAQFVHLPRGARARVLTIVIGGTFLVFSLIAVRNALVSHRFVPASTEFGITLRGGNEPPPGVRLAPGPRLDFYTRMHVDSHTIDVIEYAIAAPGSFAANLARKGLFVMGIYEPYAPGWGYSPVYLATWFAAMLGMVWLWRQQRMTPMSAMCLLAAATQFVAIAIVYPKGERLILPVNILLIPYAAIALERAAALLAPSRS